MKSLLEGERGPGGVYIIKYQDKTFEFPSVTTILSKLTDPDVEDLRSQMDDAKWQAISTAAANRGNVMHAYMENFTIGLDKLGIVNEALEYSQKRTALQLTKWAYPNATVEKGRNLFYNLYYSTFKDEYQQSLLTEGLLMNYLLGYAGRTDNIYLNKDGLVVVGDYKSSSKILDPASNKVVKYKLQASAYATAFNTLYGKKNIDNAYFNQWRYKVDECVIWVAHPEGFQKFSMKPLEIEIYYKYFEHIFNTHYVKFIDVKSDYKRYYVEERPSKSKSE